MLTFEEAALDQLIKQHQVALEENNAKNNITNGWGCGPIVSNFSGLQGAFFRIIGKQDRTPGNYQRILDDGISGATNEYFHPITRIRKNKVSNYNPESLSGYSFEKSDGEAGWRWIRRGIQAVPEYVMRPEKKMNVMHEAEYKTKPSLSRLLCPTILLADLDRDNDVRPE
jgi:hypothetical protein